MDFVYQFCFALLSRFCVWCMILQEVITAKDLASQVDVRLMATVYFKNSINRHWRQRRDSS